MTADPGFAGEDEAVFDQSFDLHLLLSAEVLFCLLVFVSISVHVIPSCLAPILPYHIKLLFFFTSFHEERCSGHWGSCLKSLPVATYAAALHPRQYFNKRQSLHPSMSWMHLYLAISGLLTK